MALHSSSVGLLSDSEIAVCLNLSWAFRLKIVPTTLGGVGG